MNSIDIEKLFDINNRLIEENSNKILQKVLTQHEHIVDQFISNEKEMKFNF